MEKQPTEIQPNETEKREVEQTTPPKKKRKMRWWVKLILWIVLLPVGLSLLVTLLFYIPAVQQFAVDKIATQVSKSMDLNLTIKKLRIGFPLKLHVEDVLALNQERDTVAYLHRFDANVPAMLLLSGDIPVKQMDLDQLVLDFSTPDSAFLLKGHVASFKGEGLLLNLQRQDVDIRAVDLQHANLAIYAFPDTTKVKEPAGKAEWLVKVNDLRVDDTKVLFTTKRDSTELDAYIEKAFAKRIQADVGNMAYSVGDFGLKGEMHSLYNIDQVEWLSMPWQMEADAKNIYYDTLHIRAVVDHLLFLNGEKWGITEGKVKVNMDEEKLLAEGLDLSVNRSYLKGDAEIPMRKFMPDTTGNVMVSLLGNVYASDFRPFLKQFEELPSNRVRLTVDASGKMDGAIKLNTLLDATDIAEFKANGMLYHAMDSVRRNASLTFNLLNEDVMSYMGMLGIENPSWTIPQGVELDGKVLYTTSKVDLNAALNTPRGSLRADGFYQMHSKAFNLDATTTNLSLQQFLPKDTIGDLRAKLKVNGRGTDPFSPHTRAYVDLAVDTFTYNNHSLGNIILISQLENQQLYAALSSDSPGMTLLGQLDAQLKKNDINASLHLDVDTLLPSYLGVNSDKILGTSFVLMASARSDMKQYHQLDGEVTDLFIATDKKLIHPTNLNLLARSSEDSLRAEVTSGDMLLSFNAQNGLNDFLDRVKHVSEEIGKFTKDTTGLASISTWIPYYPEAQVAFTMGRSNPLRSYLDEHRLGWRKMNLNLHTSPERGLSGDVYVNAFQADTFRIDEMDLTILQDTSFFYAVGAVHKEKFRNQDPFTAMVNLTTNVKYAELFANLKDKDDKDFVLLGVNAQWKPDMITIGLTPDPPVFVYNRFNIEGETYVNFPFEKGENIEARVHLLGDNDNSKILVDSYNRPEGHILQAVIEEFDLKKVKDLGFIPDMQGKLFADAKWVKGDDKDRYTAQVNLDDFHFTQKKVGDVKAVAFYEPVKGGSYAAVDLGIDSQNVATAEAFLSSVKGVQPVWRLEVDNLPLDKADPFIPDRLVSLNGVMDANVTNAPSNGDIVGQKPGEMNGQIVIDEGKVYVSPLNNTYGLDSRPIRIIKDQVQLDKYTLHTLDNTSMYFDGTVGLSEGLPIRLNVRGDDVLLVDSKKTAQSMAYGKLNVSTNMRLTGPAAALRILGSLSINGDTNLTYVLKDSKLNKRNRFEGLVEFTEFSDTLFVVKKENVDSLSLGGMDLRVALHIDPAVEVGADLSDDGSNAVHIQGGGDLNFRYPPYGQMTLSGRFDFHDGFINYNIPPILAKKFKVDRDSYVSWSGDVMNPLINFKATERVKSAVEMPGENRRKVNFDVSIVAKNRLDDLSLVFTVDAPEDISMRNNLLSMTEEERSRHAMMLLALGTFQGSPIGGGGGGYDVNNALMSLVAKEFNSLVGDALDAEINLGIEDASEYGGAPGTFYSYSIAKRFYDDRITVQVGGQVESGNARPNATQSFIDNVSIDYRLDKAGTHYLRLFHKKNYENILDGEIIETGAGYVIRRRLYRLRDLFNFKKSTMKMMTDEMRANQEPPKDADEAEEKHEKVAEPLPEEAPEQNQHATDNPQEDNQDEE